MKIVNNTLENLEKLSRFVYRLNYTDTTSEDYVYYQIIKHLAEHGSLIVTHLDRKIIIYKKSENQEKKIKIERRKLKKILEGTTKGFTGLIPLNYVSCVPEWKKRGGKQENTYYLTEKGIMASIGYYSYRQNINFKKIQKAYKSFGRKYEKFLNEFMKLQIQVYLAYYFVQGISLAFRKENDVEYDEFRQKIVESFDIKVSDEYIEKQFSEVLERFNLYRKIHLKLFPEKDVLKLCWGESRYVVNKQEPTHGFQGWYRIQFLTSLDNNLKQKKYNIRKDAGTSDKRSKGIKIKLVLEPQYLYSRFQDNQNIISDDLVTKEMKKLGLIREKRKKKIF